MTPQVDNEKCTGCGSCVEICPMDAITIVTIIKR
ncbi:MAG: 4Fe-4S binding protein [Spirochaetales bacterium]|nr:4Fe-4S binding protein [Spirochaetales bacterium]